jgi:Holliday junction resolvase-like predicted endonuclease
MRKTLFIVASCLVISPFVSLAKSGIYYGTPNQIEKALKVQKQYDYIILNLKDLGVAQFPLYKTLHLIETTNLHPLFSKTILFKDYEVASAKASFPTAQFQTYKNAIIVQPTFNFRGGTIDVVLRKGKEEMLVKVICEETPLHGVFFPYEIVVDRKILSPEEVFEKYFHLTNQIPDREVEVYIDGITYFIKPVVGRFGNLNYKGKLYLIGVRKLTP